MKRRGRDTREQALLLPLRFRSWDAAFRYAKEDVKGPVVVEIVAPAVGPGVYQVYPDGGAIRQMDTAEVFEIGLTNSAELRDGEPCGHPGCLQHVTHPCEGCGRVAGRRVEVSDDPN